MGRTIASKPKRKSGCITCRTRKVKCDEAKPNCFRCTSSGRACNGYQSLFRAEQRYFKPPAPSTGNGTGELRLVCQVRGQRFSTEQVRELSANLSSKPPAQGAIGFETEALVVLEASLSSPAVRSALLCQDTLRSHLRAHGHITTLIAENRKAFTSCIALYNKALADLSERITESNYRTIHTSLRCCQLFISVDIMQQNYVSSVKHFVSGFKILRACKGRPTFRDGHFEPASYSGLPAIDIFLLKLFTVPCPFSKQMLADDERLVEHQGSEVTDHLRLKGYRKLLYAIASQTVDIVDKARDVQSQSRAMKLIKERDQLCNAIQGLDVDLEKLLLREDLPAVRRLTIGFQLLYYHVVRTVLSSILTPHEPSDMDQESNFHQLVSVAELLRGLSEKLVPDDITIVHIE